MATSAANRTAVSVTKHQCTHSNQKVKLSLMGCFLRCSFEEMVIMKYNTHTHTPLFAPVPFVVRSLPQLCESIASRACLLTHVLLLLILLLLPLPLLSCYCCGCGCCNGYTLIY